MKLKKKKLSKFSFFKKKRNLSIIIVILIALAIPITVSMSLTRQQSEQNAQSSSSSSAVTFSDIHVQGNKLLNAQGQAVVLHGVNRSGTEYSCISGSGFEDGPSDDASIQAIAKWHANVIRIPLNEHCWLGLSDVPSQYGGANYQNFIKGFVTRIINHNMYVILDLHWNGSSTSISSQPILSEYPTSIISTYSSGTTGQQPMPDANYAGQFWQSVAKQFGNNNKVIFDLYNEPYPDNNNDSTAAWQCWKNGGNCSGVPFSALGMQSLVNTVRNAGATNVIMLGGVVYANALDQWLQYAPNDPNNNLMASVHIYPDGNNCNNTSCYNNTLSPVLKQVPLTAGEIGISTSGATDCSTSAIDTLMNWFDTNNSGYLQWTWDAWSTNCANWSLILGYTGTPKSPNGTDYKSHLSMFPTPIPPTPTPSLTITPTPTPKPTNIPTPTQIPTQTPTPTNKPSPTPTPSVICSSSSNPQCSFVTSCSTNLQICECADKNWANHDKVFQCISGNWQFKSETSNFVCTAPCQ